jgi:hypothetical protein
MINRYLFNLALIWSLFLTIPALGFEFELKSGDILLQELNCASCQRIASETGSRFSHSAVVIRSQETGDFVVVEALGSVKELPLREFVERSAPGASVQVMRSFEFEAYLSKWGSRIEDRLTKTYYNSFDGLGFDRLYLWDRVDEQGRPMLYCSEFVVKFLNHFLEDDFSARPLDFSQNWDFWQNYYQGDVPQGTPGNSPGDLERDSKLYEVGEIWPDTL